MFIKEIFSRKKKKIIEILHKKAFIEKMYEKSYVRGLVANSNRIHVLDNNSLFFNIKKSTRFKSNLIVEESRSYSYDEGVKIYDSQKKPSPKIEYKGYSSYSTTFLYKNRKNHFLRFQLPLCTLNKSRNFLNSFIKGFTRINKTKLIEGETSLIILSSNKGGFLCYSSGFQGFLPKSQFKFVITEWMQHFTDFQKKVELQFLKSFIQLQKFDFIVSLPSRFSFVLKSMFNNVTLRRKRFILSRKKRSYRCTTMAINMIFYSTKNTSTCEELFKDVVESSSKSSKSLKKTQKSKIKNHSF